ncbi:COP9 signalosome complex subunit 3-like [Acanthaster planci]|uniref:COP9 signalosome complex subunit 3 n=1 Tax=Acanthaster planci TaxID=133434 RepID=A0A8B7Z6X0_ACAPL|nr:COP9 signalosome complex subunit 3-like [Acanthaster planci]
MASQVEGFVNSVVTLSTEGNFAQLCEEINKSLELLKKNASNLDMILETLDPQLHSLGVLAVLNVKFTLPPGSAPDFETLFSQTHLFFSMCNGEQVRFATDSYATLAHQFTRVLIDKKQYLRGIEILCKAISKIQMHTAQLTSVHADLCQLCLLAKCMKPALPFLDVDITDISKEGGLFDATHFLCYYYYGGMIYAALKKWGRAVYFFEVAITTPSQAVSHIMLEAYKKYILVSLIHHGKLTVLPKYTSLVVGRFIKPLSQPYHELANAYTTNNPQDIRTVILKHSDQFTREQNMGLVKQVESSMFAKNIQRLTKTFLTLSLSDIARRVHLNSAKEAELHVLSMIEEGQIYASISKKDGMVSFHDNPEKYDNPSLLKHLEGEMRECIMLDEKLRQMEQEISVTPQFIQKSMGIREEEDLSVFASGSK